MSRTLSDSQLTALGRLIDVLSSPAAANVPAEYLHAVELVVGWKAQKGLRDRWLLWYPTAGGGGPRGVLSPVEREPDEQVARDVLVTVLQLDWLQPAQELLNSATTATAAPAPRPHAGETREEFVIYGRRVRWQGQLIYGDVLLGDGPSTWTREAVQFYIDDCRWIGHSVILPNGEERKLQ